MRVLAITCTYCNSILGVHEEDIVYYKMAHRSPPFVVKCGACGNMTEVKMGDIPKSWLSKIVGEESTH